MEACEQSKPPGHLGLEALEACALILVNTADMGTLGLQALEASFCTETSEHCRPGHYRPRSTGSLCTETGLGTVGLQALEACNYRLANSADMGTAGLQALEACALQLASTADLGATLPVSVGRELYPNS